MRALNKLNESSFEKRQSPSSSPLPRFLPAQSSWLRAWTQLRLHSSTFLLRLIQFSILNPIHQSMRLSKSRPMKSSSEVSIQSPPKSLLLKSTQPSQRSQSESPEPRQYQHQVSGHWEEEVLGIGGQSRLQEYQTRLWLDFKQEVETGWGREERVLDESREGPRTVTLFPQNQKSFSQECVDFLVEFAIWHSNALASDLILCSLKASSIWS